MVHQLQQRFRFIRLKRSFVWIPCVDREELLIAGCLEISLLCGVIIRLLVDSHKLFLREHVCVPVAFATAWNAHGKHIPTRTPVCVQKSVCTFQWPGIVARPGDWRTCILRAQQLTGVPVDKTSHATRVPATTYFIAAARAAKHHCAAICARIVNRVTHCALCCSVSVLQGLYQSASLFACHASLYFMLTLRSIKRQTSCDAFREYCDDLRILCGSCVQTNARKCTMTQFIWKNAEEGLHCEVSLASRLSRCCFKGCE
jgi:hypothetical protein